MKCKYKKINKALPPELSLFYSQVCNGCTIGELNLSSFENFEFSLDRISLEFPFNEKWIWEWEDTSPDSEPIEKIHNGNIGVIDLGCGLS